MGGNNKMNTGKTYFEKLRDPRWQKKRLEILERDNFTCQACQTKEKTLSIHHKYYDFKIEPWDYDNKTLITLCDRCHTEMDGVRKSLIHSMGYLTLSELIDLDIMVMGMDGLYERIY